MTTTTQQQIARELQRALADPDCDSEALRDLADQLAAQVLRPPAYSPRIATGPGASHLHDVLNAHGAHAIVGGDSIEACVRSLRPDVIVLTQLGAEAIHAAPPVDLTELRRACGYSPHEDGDIDALIAYKDALEDELGRHGALFSDHADS